jgi:hypothetical protein
MRKLFRGTMGGFFEEKCEGLSNEAFRKIVHALVILVESKKLNADSEYSPRTAIYLNALKI